jgi:hypothetical protein
MEAVHDSERLEQKEHTTWRKNSKDGYRLKKYDENLKTCVKTRFAG